MNIKISSRNDLADKLPIAMYALLAPALVVNFKLSKEVRSSHIMTPYFKSCMKCYPCVQNLLNKNCNNDNANDV